MRNFKNFLDCNCKGRLSCPLLTLGSRKKSCQVGFCPCDCDFFSRRQLAQSELESNSRRFVGRGILLNKKGATRANTLCLILDTMILSWSALVRCEVCGSSFVVVGKFDLRLQNARLWRIVSAAPIVTPATFFEGCVFARDSQRTFTTSSKIFNYPQCFRVLSRHERDCSGPEQHFQRLHRASSFTSTRGNNKEGRIHSWSQKPK